MSMFDARGGMFDIHWAWSESGRDVRLEDVLRKLRTLGPRMRRKALAASLRKGVNIVRNAAKANARRIDDPETATAIWRNIGTRTDSRAGRQRGGVVIKVGVRGGAMRYANTALNQRRHRVGQRYATFGDARNPGGDTWYWRFIEFGTATQDAKPFLLPALENNAQRATNAIVSELNRQIDRLIEQDAHE